MSGYCEHSLNAIRGNTFEDWCSRCGYTLKRHILRNEAEKQQELLEAVISRL